MLRTYTILLLLLSGYGVIAQSQRKPAVQQRPNIIFVLTDDHRWDALGAMGNTIIKTPNLDTLANKGILFKNAYVTTSICCVSRASILAGQYESRHKINDFNTDFSPEAVKQTYPVLLKNAGYKIGFVGKYGVGVKNQPKDLYDYWSCTPKVQPDYLLKNGKGEKIHNTDSVSSDISKFLALYAGKGPFCLSVGFKAPHELDGDPPKLIAQDRFKDLYKDVTIPVPETADPKYWDSFPDFFKTDVNVARVRWKALFSTPESYQENVKKYYQLITGVDEAMGKMVAQLKQLGIDKNIIIIFMGDNGFYLGEHGLEGKWYGHEESIRVPLLIYDPRQPTKLAGTKPQQIALNVDIAPTVLKMAGVQVPNTMQGLDLVGLVNKKVPERTSFFYEHTYGKSPRIPRVEGVVSANFKYMKYIEHGYEELYDLAHDPHETKNIAGDAKYKVQLEKLRAEYTRLKKNAS